MWMNRYDVEEAVRRFERHPVLGPAARFLDAFVKEVDAHSDGWPYWHVASKSADKLTTLLYTELMRGMGAYRDLGPEPTLADVRKTLTPIKAFMTRRGTAAGMRLPELEVTK